MPTGVSTRVTSAANGGFYSGPARQAVAAVLEEVTSTPDIMLPPGRAPAHTTAN